MFIEVTIRQDETTKALINVSAISRIFQNESEDWNIEEDAVFISFMNGDDDIEITESYDYVKSMFKKAKSASNEEVDRFELIDMDED